MKALFSSDTANSVNSALIDLFDYSITNKRAVQRLKVIYHVKSNKCMIDSKLSNHIHTTEITKSLMNQSAYLINSLIDNYKIIYNKYFLDKIIFEANLDELGIVYESIKVGCTIRTNLSNYHIDSWNLVNTVLNTTVEAERSEILERPATNLILNLQRKKLRNFSLIFNYSDDYDENTFKANFAKEVKAMLEVLIRNYCNYNSNHQASVVLNFDIAKRNHLTLYHGSIYPTKKLITQNGHFAVKDTKHIIMQLAQTLSLVPNSSLEGVMLTRHPKGHFVTSFGIQRIKNAMPLNVDLTASYQLTKILNNLLAQYIVPSLYKDWIHKINASLEFNELGFLAEYKGYKLIKRFNSPITLAGFKAVAIKAYTAISNGTRCVSNIKLSCKNSLVCEAELEVSNSEADIDADEPLQDLVSTTPSTNTKIIYDYINTVSGYYLNQEEYLGWVSV